MVGTEVVRVVVRHGLLLDVAGLDLGAWDISEGSGLARTRWRTYGLSVDDAGHLERELPLHLAKCRFETRPLRRAGRVIFLACVKRPVDGRDEERTIGSLSMLGTLNEAS